MKMLPDVWDSPCRELIVNTMKLAGERNFAVHSVFPSDPAEWMQKRKEILFRLGKAMRLEVDHTLPLD